MLIRHVSDIKGSDITPQGLYLARRRFLAGSAVLGAAAVTGGPALAATGDDKITPRADATSYNNFYELGFSKEAPKQNADDLRTANWRVEIGGAVHKPGTWDMETLGRRFPAQERVYRLRCVEGWSMVIPWLGFPLHALLRAVEPTGSARYVAFQTIMDPKNLPGQRVSSYPWPYREGLRLDEAMNDLTLIATGMYGGALPNQNGAPLRLVVPWKYGFKSIKSIVRIHLQEEQPPTLWQAMAPQEYGFYANVNPEVDHPRWSQARERRIGEFFRRPTLMFNGYGDQVAHLYRGMDLRKHY